MTQKQKLRVGPLFGSALVVAFGGAAACSDGFSTDDCVVTHTCPPREVAGAAGAEAGPSDAGGAGGKAGGDAGANGDDEAGGRANGDAGANGDGDAGAGGASACEYESCECEEGDTRACGPEKEQGICHPGTQTCAEGAWGECVDAIEAQGRDCTSPLDNDCDGKADNIIDESCKCVPGDKEACGEHPGLDGNGPCVAGERVCTGTGSSGVWGGCVGAVGPKASDRCDKKDDDSDCDGEPNGGCSCLEGEKSICGDVYAATLGACVSIELTCTSTGKWPSSTTCGTTKTEVCDDANKDENCNGVVDENCDCPENASEREYDPSLVGECCRKDSMIGFMVQNATSLGDMICRYTDLAAGMKATSDSEAPNYPATNVTDSSLTTLWKANDTSTGHWVKVDLGELVNLKGVAFKFETPGSYGYKVETSGNNLAWSLRSSDTSDAAAKWQDANFGTVSNRYIRITFTSLPAGKSAALSSVRIY